MELIWKLFELEEIGNFLSFNGQNHKIYYIKDRKWKNYTTFYNWSHITSQKNKNLRFD